MTVLRSRAKFVRWPPVLLGSLAIALAACDGGDGGARVPAPQQASAPVPVAVPPAIAPLKPTQPSAASAVVDPAAPGPGENGTAPTGPVYVGPITQGVNTDQSLPAHPVRGPTASLPEGTRQIGH